MPLCQHCTLITIASLVDHDMLFHPNLASLKSSAEQGCEFCSLCWHALQLQVNHRQLESLVQGKSAWEEGEPWTPSMWLRGWNFSRRGRQGAMIDISCGMSWSAGSKTLTDGELEPKRNPSLVNAYLEVYELPGQPSKYELAGRRSTVDQNPELYIQLIQAWLRNGCTQHTACRPWSGDEMPTRVIDVGETKDEPTVVRLVSTRGMREKYTALSYCWGPDTAGIPTLSSSTYTTFTQGVKTSELARTHREAVFLAHALGIRYIWIDALCILQDDVPDWERESKTMARVYGNADFTVIAGRSVGTKDGFIANELWGDHVPRPCQLPVDGPFSSSTLTVGLRRNENVGPASGRGWCFQESKLSRRAVVFGEQQLIFQCATEKFFENGVARAINRHPRPVYKPPTPHEEALQTWYSSLFEYTKCSLSNPHDIFAASTAVAQQTSVALRSRYLAGIWEGDIIRGLLWRPCYQFSAGGGDKAAVRPRSTTLTRESGSITRSPSWSWAAVEGQVTQVRWSVQLKALAKRYRDPKIRPKHSNPERWSLDDRCGVEALHMPTCELQFIGQVTNLQVLAEPVTEYYVEAQQRWPSWVEGQEGDLRRGIPRPIVSQYGVLLGKNASDNDMQNGEPWGHVAAIGYFDVQDERNNVDHVWCLPVMGYMGLMLRKQPDGKFCRLGWFLLGQEDWFSAQEEADICLC